MSTRYRIADTYSVPFVNCGMEWWHVVDINDPKRVVASHVYPGANVKHPEYDRYMELQRQQVQKICDALNSSGLTL